MDKVKQFLESYVQWVALALGVAFLGYAGYAFIYSQPDAVPSVGSQTNVAPEEVDKIVADGPAAALKRDLESKSSVSIPEIAGTYVEDNVVGKIKKAPDAQSVAIHWTPLSAPQLPEGVKAVDLNSQKVLVKALPVVPAIVNLQWSGGHCNIAAPAPAGGVAAVGADGKPLAIDKNWQTIEGQIPVADLAKAIETAGIPPSFHTVAILRVKLYRQERNTDGSWGPEIEIPGLEITPLNDMPAEGSPVDVQNTYRGWAESNVALICQPPFYPVLQGDVWYEPGTPNPNIENTAIIDDGFDPNHPGNFKGDPSTLTVPHRKIYDEYIEKLNKRNNAQRTPNRTTPTTPNTEGLPGVTPTPNGGNGNNNGTRGGRTGGGRGGRTNLAGDGQRNQPGDGLTGPPTDNPGLRNPMNPTGGQAGPANTAAAQATLPAGSFDPASPQAAINGDPAAAGVGGAAGAAGGGKNIRVWAHDSTAVSGHTYHYSMKYVITNPVAHTSNLCDPPKLADTFAIESAPSAWTEPVSVESDTSFYATEIKGHNIRFNVFKWKNGVWQMQDVVVGPGDMVGSSNTDATGLKTEFATGWTVVDIRDDPRDTDNKIIVLVSETGSLKKKDLNLDNHSQQFQHLRGEVEKNKPAAATGAPGTTPRPNL